MTAIILAAGYGTRLYPLTLDKPKAFLEVGGKTILDRLIEKLKAIGECKRIYIVTNDKFYGNFKEWLKPNSLSPEVHVINDKTVSNETRLGAIGDIHLVLKENEINDDLVITGSDNLFESGLKEFYEFGRGRRPFSSLALFDVKDKNLSKKYGICSLDGTLRITDFEEKPQAPKSTLAATALYFIPREKIEHIYKYMQAGLSKDAPGNLIKWLAEKDKVFGYILKGKWYDIGDLNSLKKADEDFKRKETP
ncbi:MAG: nucleotidyltransferase family protein [Candidatus Omnitrophica bacterium]|nr:nucleotidyltransferase family protein [Candidatus Omnitrophota bacterium]